jgi:hypothetical protein
MKQLVIIHFHPIEEYPPILNLLQVIAEKRKDLAVTVLTNYKTNQHFTFEIDNPQIEIKRIADVDAGKSIWQRYLAYYNFFRKSAAALTKINPDNILYFDPISSISAYRYYTKNKRASAKLFIHHHEYVSTQEIASARGLMKWAHAKEKVLLQKATWISQTNEERMNFFLQDHGLKKDERFHIMPNWPLQKWNARVQTDRPIDGPLRVVYVGALGMDTMYVKEFSEWVMSQNGKVYWDVFSQQQASETVAYFNGLNSPYIQFKGQCKYENLPEVLQRYHVGVILYKGHIPNYVYNAPNKLFEYHVCGLDCWFPQQMVSAAKHSTRTTYPKILGVDFTRLSELSDFSNLTDRSELRYDLKHFYAENACSELVEKF